MRGEADRLAAARQTGRWAAANCALQIAVLAAVLAASCSCGESPDAAYNRIREVFLSGDLDKAIAGASASGARWNNDRTSPWFWKFRLLQAEALTLESKNKDAADLLSDPVPARAELSQLEVRRLIDKEALIRAYKGRGGEACCKQARAGGRRSGAFDTHRSKRGNAPRERERRRAALISRCPRFGSQAAKPLLASDGPQQFVRLQ